VTTHLKSARAGSIALTLLFVAQLSGQATSQGQTTNPGQAKSPPQTVAPKPGSLALTVVSEAGPPLAGAAVSLRGSVDRQALTSADGVATLLNIPAGTYRARISHDGFISFEKEITVRAATRATAEAMLSAAPSPPPPPPAPEPKETPKPVQTPTGPVGAPKVLSVSDLAEQMLKDPAPIVERELGCSVASSSRLILVREPLTTHTHADADEMLYLVAGDATLRIAEKDTPISAGWFALVPRVAAHSLTRRGRNAPIFLSIRSGAPCGG
jgi:mannose-6-phosphate isomerase-like protein (cupin superfamily)